MRIAERQIGDVDRLNELIAAERDADQRDRYRVALLAVQGFQKHDIASLLSVAKSTVEQWAYRYRDGGVDALIPAPRGGRTPRLSPEAAERLRARIDAGPLPEDKVCTLRGKDVQRIIRHELGVDLSLSAVYRTLERMDYSCLAPRPRHEKQDQAAQVKFREQTAPFFSPR
jgi:transposase